MERSVIHSLNIQEDVIFKSVNNLLGGTSLSREVNEKADDQIAEHRNIK